MNLWHLEWLRLTRTRRLLAIVGVYVFFGLTGPLTARYLRQILGQVGTEGIQITFPNPVPADGVEQFVGNAAQLGILVVVVVAASALAFDARREMAVFLRTRVDNVRDIVVPAYAVNAGAAIMGFVAGSLAAWYETAVLLGSLPPLRMVIGIAYGSLFLAFAVAMVAFVAAAVRSVPTTAGVTLMVLLGMAIIGGITGRERWLPTGLASALSTLARGAPAGDYLPAAGIAATSTVVLVVAAVMIGSRREI